jgi:hypothetical protein
MSLAARGHHSIILQPPAYVPFWQREPYRVVFLVPWRTAVVRCSKWQRQIPKNGRSSLNRNDIEFYFESVFHLNRSARDAYGLYAEGALLDRCGTAIVATF